MSGPERERSRGEQEILISSMFGLFSKEGRVKVELVEQRRSGGDKRLHVLLDPAEARRQAMYMLEAAGAAERDAAFWTVARSMGMSEDDAGRFLQACREAHERNSSDDDKDGPAPPS